MRRLIAMVMSAAAMAAAVSCAQEEFDDYVPAGTVSFTAVHASDDVAPADEPDSKTILDAAIKKSVWTKGDAIAIHNGDKAFEFTTQDEGESAQFTYSGGDFVTDGGVIAVYPCDEEVVADVAKKTVSVTIPGEQVATVGSYDPDAAVSVAYSTDDHLRFKNATALLKFSVATQGVKSVVFSGLGSEAVCGAADVAFAAEDNTVASVTLKAEDTGTSVSLTAEEYFEVGETYYMAIAPQTFSKGFTFSFRFVEDGPLHVAKKHEQSRTIRRNLILNVGELAVDLYAGLTNATPKLNSMKFTVANNPGKILSREFTHTLKTSTFSSSYNVNTSTVTEKSCTIADGKVSLYVPYLNDRKLVPTFTIPSGTALMYEGGLIESGKTEVDFAKYKEIRVVNGNKEEAVYTIDFTNTGLPVVVVNQKTGIVTSESNSEYKKASTAWYNATGAGWLPKDSDWEMTEGDDYFMVYNPDGTSALVDKKEKPVDGPIASSTRLRGNVTQQMPKKSFAVKLDKKSGVLGMKPHKRWVLLANWKDRTLIRNEVAFGIAEVFRNTLEGGMEWNPSGQHVELVYNGVHVGNYYLCEQVKIDGNRLDINEPLDEEDNPWTGDPSVFGYLIEADDGYDETYKFTTACYIPFLLKDDANDEMLAYASDFVRGIEDNLYAGFSNSNAASYEAAFEKMDLTSFVDFLLIQELMMNSEMKHPKSCYHYINNGKMYAGPLWDFDWNTLPVSTSYSEEGYSYTESMIKKEDASHKKSGYPSEPMSDDDANYIWYPMLVKNADFAALAAERWNKVSAAVSAYVSGIGELQKALSKSADVNDDMWPVDSKGGIINPRYSIFGIGGGYCGDEGSDFSTAVSTLQSTLNTRIGGMNSFVSNKNWPTASYTSKN